MTAPFCRSSSILASCLDFQDRKTSASKLVASSSTFFFAHLWQSQMPLVALFLSSEARESSARGPPDDAAMMRAATPTLILGQK